MREKFVSWDCRENEASRVWQTSLIVNYHGLFYCAAMQSRKRNIYKLNCLNRSTNVWQKFPRKPIFLAKPSRLRLPLTLADQLLQTSFFLSPFTKKKPSGCSCNSTEQSNRWFFHFIAYLPELDAFRQFRYSVCIWITHWSLQHTVRCCFCQLTVERFLLERRHKKKRFGMHEPNSE